MDPEQKKKALRNFTYGVYVLTVNSGHDYAAATVTWVSQASLDPPRIMLGLRRGSKTAELAKKEKGFTLNILGESQKSIASAFLKHAIVEGETINGYPFKKEVTGSPILTDAPAYLECKIVQLIDGTDHDVVIAEVINAGAHADMEPLNLRTTGWRYGG
jgi:flavin reductase (DIM6/NTAB) family NADH-FMN oxidoreductase RutF